MSIEWLRLWHDMPTDPKWRVIARASGQPISAVIATFNFMLINASVADNRGCLENFRAEPVAAALDMETDEIEAILAAMQGWVLDGDHLTGWEKRQPKREDDSADRVRAYRERRKVLPSVTEDGVTQCNAAVTQRNAPDKESDKDSEKEKKDSRGSDEPAADAANKVVSLPARGESLSFQTKKGTLFVPAGKDMEGQCFALADQILGHRTGGMVAKLAKIFRYDWKAVRKVILTAHDKHDPKAWVGRYFQDSDLAVEEFYAGWGAH